MLKKNIITVGIMVLFLAGSSYAQDAADQGNSSHHTPSQAAIDACSGKSQGDTCDYTNAKGEDKSGACASTSDGQTIFCKRSKS